MKKYSTFTLNKAAIIQYFLHDSSSGSHPAKLIKKKKIWIQQQLNSLSLYHDTEKS